ncbi:MAG: hypothetical protein NT076_01935 [Candidatus Pacearchaeota archaeon]|nr:hypothetical protein [Candidatus Pacearchaeota archaeon]
MAANEGCDGQVQVLSALAQAGYRLLSPYASLVTRGLAQKLPPERITRDLLAGIDKSPIKVLERIA